jgi:hypothetical protein
MSVADQLTNLTRNMLKYPEYLSVYTDGIAEVLRRHPGQAADLFGVICQTLMTYPTDPEHQQRLTRYVHIGGVHRLRHTTPVRNLLEDADYRSALQESLRAMSEGLVIQQEIIADLFPE